jgi:hypothetical protein
MNVTAARRGVRRSRRYRWSSVVMPLALVVLLAATLGGCASTSGATSPQLRCMVRIAPAGVDVIQTTLQCTVTNAPRNDTRFTLRYALVDDAGKPQQPFDAPCEGALAQGTGTCQQTYSVIAPKSPTDSSISGESLPSHTSLGPMTPTQATS